MAIDLYKIEDGGALKIKNIKTVVENPTIAEGETLTGRFVKELVDRKSVDKKVTNPDAGRITKFGPVYNYNNEEFILIPADMAAVKLPLYRAGAGTTVTIPAIDTTEAAEATPVIITPTLSEEVVYYVAACKELGLTYVYEV